MGEQKTLINILGAGRSGTTMLDLMLGNDEQSFSLGEVHAWFRPFRKHHFKIDCNCGDENCSIWKKISGFREQDFHRNAFNLLNVQFLIDSSKNLVWTMDSITWARNHKFRSINIVVYKPVLDYVFSIWKRGETIETAISRYKQYYGRFLQSGLEAVSVDFQELVSNTNEVLEGILKLTKQPTQPERADFWKKEHHHLFGSGGVRTQSQQGDSSIKVASGFSDEFQLMVPELCRRIGEDKELLDIVDKLKSIDYRLVKSLSESKVTRVKPIWYYYLKTKRRLARYYPDNRDMIVYR